MRQHDKYQREENITQTVVITTYCNERQAPSAPRFFETHQEDESMDNYFPGIRIRLNGTSAALEIQRRSLCAAVSILRSSGDASDF